MQVLTTGENNKYVINLKTDYSRLDMTCTENELNTEIVLNPASTPYKIYVENKGNNANSIPETMINIALG